jgi:hypothetical protein
MQAICVMGGRGDIGGVAMRRDFEDYEGEMIAIVSPSNTSP